MLQYNLRNRSDSQTSNQTYEAHPTYLNFTQEPDPRSYDLPRLLQPPNVKNLEKRSLNKTNSNSSPLQSPTDSESVFTDEDWPHSGINTSHGKKKIIQFVSTQDLFICCFEFQCRTRDLRIVQTMAICTNSEEVRLRIMLRWPPRGPPNQQTSAQHKPTT